MVKWQPLYTRPAQKDAKKLARSGPKEQAQRILNVLEKNPLEPDPPYEKTVGDLAGACSRRIDIQHRVVYQVLKREHIVKIVRLWTHYE